MRDSPVSTERNGFQHAGRISLKQSMFENRAFGEKLEIALGTVDRFPLCGLLSATYKIDHLSKQQVVSSDQGDQH
jgi:hypothetical protein